MFNTKFLDDLAKKLSEAIPTTLLNAKADIEKNFHQILHAAFSKLDLVTREEFEVQMKVLAKTRAKLEKLEKKIAELEKHIAKKK